ncbi:MAG: transketolase [bacterium]|nr:transketolase [bacterium]
MDRFSRESLTSEELKRLERLGVLCRGDILKMTTLAKQGHPGGSMSSIDIYITLYSFANVNPKDPYNPNRDRIVISHGHTSPGVYSVLGRFGFVDLDKAIAHFRQAGSIFEGHIERTVPGVEWTTGNLGQGLSAGCGFAIAGRIKGLDFHTFVVMGDGEQQKGQLSEARRFAVKYNLPITAIIDNNGLQISGTNKSVMPQDIKANYLSDGWEVLEIDGHNYQEIYQAIRYSLRKKKPVAIIAHTVMGKGVSFMENKEVYHGKALTMDEYKKAMVELGLDDDLDEYKRMRDTFEPEPHKFPPNEPIDIDTGSPFIYKPGDKVDNRSAFGNALKDLGERNNDGKHTPIVVFDCDLASSVKTDGFSKVCPSYFFQVGIQEHNAATIAGAVSTQGVISFFADFGVFGVDETYNQHRLNSINNTNLKLITTHCGLDVGSDGKTHQCIDYVGVMRNLFDFKVIVPADPNQTDIVTRYVAKTEGNFLIAMGRSVIPIITDEAGNPFYNANYKFEYGKADLLRDGKDGAIITMGTMVYRAIRAWEILRSKGISVKVINVSCPLALDRLMLREACGTGLLVTYEDHNVNTGLGSIVASAIGEEGLKVKLIKLGVTSYGASGESEELFKMYGLDTESLVKVIEKAKR